MYWMLEDKNNNWSYYLSIDSVSMIKNSSHIDGIFIRPECDILDNLKINDDFQLNLRIKYYLCVLNTYGTLVISS